MSNVPVLRGVIHGKTIELDIEPGLPAGQEVSVTVEPLSDTQSRRESLQRAFGAWAEHAEEVDEFVEWNRRERKIDRPEIEP